MAFWGNREKAKQKQIEAGTVDQGERVGVTAGKNMDGKLRFIGASLNRQKPLGSDCADPRNTG